MCTCVRTTLGVVYLALRTSFLREVERESLIGLELAEEARVAGQ